MLLLLLQVRRCHQIVVAPGSVEGALPCFAPTLQVHLPLERLQDWLPFWHLSGAESLLATAMGFLLRQRLHLPLQCATLAVALASLPAMCAQVCGPVGTC